MIASQRNGLLAAMMVMITAVMSALIVWTHMRGDPFGALPQRALSSSARAPGNDKSTPNTQVDTEMRELQLRARYLWQRGGAENRLAAERLLTDVIRAAPEYADAQALLAVVYLSGAGDHQQAMHFAHAALGLEPDHVEALAALGRAAAKERRWRDALAHLHRATTLDPVSSLAQQWLGAVLADLGYLQQAHERALRALEIDPSRASANRFMGDVLVLLGDDDQALRYRQMAQTFGDADGPMAINVEPLHDNEFEMSRLPERMRDPGFTLASVWRPDASAVRSHPHFVAALDALGITALWRERGAPDLCRLEGDSYVCR